MTQDLPAFPADDGAQPSSSNVVEFSVSEISSALKRTVEGAFGHVRVRGEISRPRQPGSGHVYLTLKDDKAVLDAVCWRGTVSRLTIRPEEGMEVVCTGRLTTYAGQSKYQLVIEAMELAGEGALLKLLEERRRRLAAEGLFEEARKQTLPFLPDVIGVVTSPTGAVIRDILHRLAERFPRHVLIWPVPVQGDGAAAKIAAAITGFNGLAIGGSPPRPDVLIVARGGGSLEDLMAFNEEVVVRAVVASSIPVISAVGHETDTTLIDHAADRRAPTPSAAAEMAVPVRAELRADILDRAGRLVGGIARTLGDRRMRVESLGRGLGDPRRLLEGVTQRLDDRIYRLERVMPAYLEARRAALANAGARLPHPRQTLSEGRRRLDLSGDRLRAGLALTLRWRREGLSQLVPRLAAAPLDRQCRDGASRVAELWDRLGRAVRNEMTQAARGVEAQGKLLDSYSYKKALDRGFVVVRTGDGEAVSNPEHLSPGQGLDLEFAGERRVPVRVEGPGEGEDASPLSRAGQRRPGGARKAKPTRDGTAKEEGDVAPRQKKLL